MENLKPIITERINQINKIREQYEQIIPALFFSLGFIFDLFTLGEIDDLSNIFTLGVYLFLATSILVIEYLNLEKPISKSGIKAKLMLSIFEYKNDIFHFLTGSLLSAFTLFYFKSGSVSNSFFFFLIMISLLLLNEIEIFQKRGLIMKSSVYMLCFISYLIYLVPIIFGEASSVIFYSSIVCAISFSVLANYLLTKHNSLKSQNIRQLLIPQISISLIFICLYFVKVLPPIPLSLKTIGIYHEVKKLNGEYVTKDMRPWYQFWNQTDEDFQARPGDKIYVFTKIFSPGNFSSKVYLHWLKDGENGFKTSDKIALNVTGGRKEGFRGYAYKSNYTEGNWQVRVETGDGLEIGRINFSIKNDSTNSKRIFSVVNQ
jgi:hypothetical protein